MLSKNTYADPTWFDPSIHPEFSSWLAKCEKDNSKVVCFPCQKDVSLSNMGVRALTSHSSGEKHRRNCSMVKQTIDISSFFVPKKTSSCSSSTKCRISHSKSLTAKKATPYTE